MVPVGIIRNVSIYVKNKLDVLRGQSPMYTPIKDPADYSTSRGSVDGLRNLASRRIADIFAKEYFVRRNLYLWLYLSTSVSHVHISFQKEWRGE